MKMSRLLAPTLREEPGEAEVVSHKLMLRAGMIRKLAAGVYTFLPLGLRTLHKVINIVREEMNRSGAQEVFMPTLLPAELWQETGRWGIYGKELFRIKDRHDRDFCLGPTHEEIITELARNNIRSYKQLPINLYQIQTKFRDEVRPRFGLMRGREFMMKDAYSFHDTEASLKEQYKNMFDTYCRIFDRMGLKYKVVEADSGAIGGGYSQEYMVLADTGEDEIFYCDDCAFAISGELFQKNYEDLEKCPKCGKGKMRSTRGIEVGHIFQLGTKYSAKMKAVFLDENNQEKPFIMGCYGIGIGRAAAAAIEQRNDKDGIIWPKALAPYLAVIIPANSEEPQQMEVAAKLYDSLPITHPALRDEVVFDDRVGRIGPKLKDADLIGYPIKIIVGKSLGEGKLEIKLRSTGISTLVEIDKVPQYLKELIEGEL